MIAKVDDELLNGFCRQNAVSKRLQRFCAVFLSDLESILGQGNIRKLPVFYHKVNMVLSIFLSNASNNAWNAALALCVLNKSC